MWVWQSGGFKRLANFSSGQQEEPREIHVAKEIRAKVWNDVEQRRIMMQVTGMQEGDQHYFACLQRTTKDPDSWSAADIYTSRWEANPGHSRKKRELTNDISEWFETNAWLHWADFTARSLYPEGDCYVCSKQWLKTYAVPVPFSLLDGWKQEESGVERGFPAWGGNVENVSFPRCVLEIGSADHPWNNPNRFQNGVLVLDVCKRKFPNITESQDAWIKDYAVDRTAKYECFHGPAQNKTRWRGTIPDDLGDDWEDAMELVRYMCVGEDRAENKYPSPIQIKFH